MPLDIDFVSNFLGSDHSFSEAHTTTFKHKTTGHGRLFYVLSTQKTPTSEGVNRYGGKLTKYFIVGSRTCAVLLIASKLTSAIK